MESRILEEHRQIRSLAAAEPDADALATLFFKHGISAKALSDFAADRQLEIAAIELKILVSPERPVFTAGIGARDLMRAGGDLHTRLRQSISQVRTEIAMLAADTEVNALNRFRQADSGESMDIYKVQVVGPRTAIAGLLGEEPIAAVFIDESDRKVKEFRELQARESAFSRRDRPAMWPGKTR